MWYEVSEDLYVNCFAKHGHVSSSLFKVISEPLTVWWSRHFFLNLEINYHASKPGLLEKYQDFA